MPRYNTPVRTAFLGLQRGFLVCRKTVPHAAAIAQYQFLHFSQDDLLAQASGTAAPGGRSDTKSLTASSRYKKNSWLGPGVLEFAKLWGMRVTDLASLESVRPCSRHPWLLR